MKETWKFICEKIKANKKTMLLVVIDNNGSSPGQAGFKMAIADDGTMKGSIGGGETEFRLVEMAKAQLKKNDSTIRLKREVHQPDAVHDSSGMICSGEQWVAFYTISAQELNTVESILDALEHDENGMLHFSQNGIVFNRGEGAHHQHKNPVTSNEEWHFSESTGKSNHLYIFGAGHVGLALSEIAATLGFVIHIFDDRQNLDTLEMNAWARFKKVIDYNDAGRFVPDEDHVYAVIMTFGHKSDELVLRQLLNKKIRYLGMMGSHKKVKTILGNLQQEGFALSDLEKLHAPVGLPIGSQTPHEIAISVVAEMIRVKNEKV